jgi:hypothetical protein
VRTSLTVPSVSFPDGWSAFITIATCSPGLMLPRFMLFTNGLSLLYAILPSSRQRYSIASRRASCGPRRLSTSPLVGELIMRAWFRSGHLSSTH